MNATAVVVALLIGGAFSLWLARQLNRIDMRLEHLTRLVIDNRDFSSLHDACHPVFSLGQLRQARQRFEREHRNQLRLETQLNLSEGLGARESSSTPSLSLKEQLGIVCEAVVESECAWREYVFMVEGNILVANRGVSRARVLEEYRNMLKETRGIAAKMTVSPNPKKVARADELLENWVARLSGAEIAGLHVDIPDLDEEMFDLGEEVENRRKVIFPSIP